MAMTPAAALTMMMESFEAPNIRWSRLPEEDHEHEEEDGHEDEVEDHPSYTEGSLKPAVTKGINPADEELAWVMPIWEMTEDQLNDLIAYLQSLE